MNIERILQSAKHIKENPSSPLLHLSSDDELAPVADFINELLEENRILRQSNETAFYYIRQKIDQLLLVIGTIPLRPEELYNATLIRLDPIGIIAESFSQILVHQRQTNDQLEMAMDEIRAIFESVGGGLLVLDTNKKIISHNDALKQMFDIKEEQIDGFSCSDIICKGSYYGPCPFDELLQTGQTVSMLAGFKLKSTHYNIIATPVKDKNNKIVRIVLLYTDITELIKAKEAVANQKERLSLTLSSIAEGVVATDTQGSITLMNEVAEELTGWSRDEAMGKSACQVLNIQNKGEKDSCTNIFEELKRGNSRFKRISQTTLTSKDDRERLITLSAAPIRMEDQTDQTGSIIVFRDITQEKKMETELVRAKKIESLGLVAGGIAHDFNNLLTAILGNVSLAKILVNDNDKIATLLDATEKVTYRAKKLTSQLLTFAKGGTPVTTLTSTRELIEESAQFSSSGSKLKCHFYIADDLWPIKVDEGQISQVIQNLVINADQAMKHGGFVNIGAENIIFDKNNENALRAGKYIKITVKDSGEGIESQYLEKIFDPYFTTKKEGHGLGLSICYSIIIKHNGHITVESQQGIGTTFTLYLPAADQQLPELPDQDFHPENKEKTKPKHNNLLVMEDEEMIRDIASQMLDFLGYRVELASDGQEALEKYKQAVERGEPFDAVIIDLTIPGGMGGKETMEHLLRLYPEIKAIVSSGYANDPIMADFRNYGFKGMMPKPFNMEDLSNTLKTVLNVSDVT